MNNSIVGLARTPEHLDVFSIGGDGRMRTAWWHEAAQWSGTFPIGGYFPVGAPVSAVARSPNNLDLFVVGNDGRVYSSWWSAGYDWSGVNDTWRSLGGYFPVGAPVSAVARSPNNLDLFVVGNDGRVYTSWWSAGRDWSGVNDTWRSLGGYFPVGAPVSAVARSPDNLDLFVVGNDGRVYTSWWSAGYDWSGVNDTWRSLGGYFPVGAPVSAVARSPNNLDLFVVGNDGRVYTSWWSAGRDWSGVNDTWRSLGGYFPVGAPVSAVARSPNNLDLFVVGNDGRVYTSWWSAGRDWSGVNDTWRSLGGYFPVGAPVSAVARSPNNLDLFVVGNDGQMYTSWWFTGIDWSGVNDTWISLLRGVQVPSVFTSQIVSGGLAALGGWLTITIYPDGSIRWQGHAHNSGADNYDFGVSAIVRTPSGRAVALVHSGHVGGTFSSDSRDHDWDVTQPPDTWIAANFGEFINAQMQTNLEYSSDIGSALEKAVGWLLKFSVGAVLAPVGAVLFVGIEIGSLISTDSLVPGARLAEGILWMAGPGNTVFAIIAHGIASLGSRTRELTEEEYDWANNEVFSGALPPRNRIVLTDTIGGDNRAFTFPRFDGKITLNMGSVAFDDPRNYPGFSWGQTFIHELVHACQIQHTNIDLTLLADAFASKICEATGGNPYAYGNAGPDYLSFNLEQQAQIVSDWFAGAVPAGSNQSKTPKDESSPYFRYVTDNVRIGRL